MEIALKIILITLFIASIFFGRLVFGEYKLFNADIETKNTSLAERILVNGLIFIVSILLLAIMCFSVYCILGKITFESYF
tara:strand:- start:414 stop:653 length:240 start_codon:yes stop_codon:yes gene_type:complete